MPAVTDLTFFHAPNTRSTGVRILLDELGLPHAMKVLNFPAGEHRQPAFLALNPMGKVPALKHGDAVVTEQIAIYMYLADLWPQAGLAPALDDPLRGPYLRWMAFYSGCFEPAAVDRAMKRDPAPQAMNPYGSFDSMLSTLLGQLAHGPWMLGERFSALDVLWGTGLGWITRFKLVPMDPVIAAYLQRYEARPAVLRVRALDAELAQSLACAPPPG